MRNALPPAVLLAAAVAWAAAPVEPRRFDALDWKPVVSLPPGAEYALLHEDPATHGVEALVRFPRSYEVPAHAHSHAERLLMVAGRLVVTSEGGESPLRPGDLLDLEAGTPHGFRTGFLRGAVFHVKTDKPFDVLKG